MTRALIHAMLLASLIAAQQPQQQPPPRQTTILAVGAHAGDMEITAGAVLAKHAARGDKVVLLHLSLGEKGNPRLSAREYGAQKKREAEAAGKELGASEVLYGPWADGGIPDDESARQFVAQAIQRVRPTTVITHWRESMHKDHSRTHSIVRDAVLLAALEDGVAGGTPHRGVRGVYYADNWEDRPNFQAYVAVEVSSSIERWRAAVTKYEFIRGGVSRFPYLEYYEALAKVRGAEAGLKQAEVFDVEPEAKRRTIDMFP
jgi:N-acetylglucosamine malate deacetylase 1